VATGIEVRHRKGCAALGSGKCACDPSYRVVVWSAVDGKSIRRTFGSLSAARAWQADAKAGVRRGLVRAASPATVSEAADVLLAGMRSGVIRNRSGEPYKPSVVRSYEQSLFTHILPDLGARKVSELKRRDLQRLVDAIVRTGAQASTVRNAFLPLRVIFRLAIEDGAAAINPCAGLRLPAVRGKRERFAEPGEAAALVAAVPLRDRAIWATAFYAGLRRGELRALRWCDVDLASAVIRVNRSWDRLEGAVTPKSSSGRRLVPIGGTLRDFLAEHRAGSRWSDDAGGLAFGRTPTEAFEPSTLSDRAAKAWSAVGLRSITLHEARHTYASLMAAAGVPLEDVADYMGHSTVEVTRSLYRHLYPHSRRRAAEALETFLEDSAKGPEGKSKGKSTSPQGGFFPFRADDALAGGADSAAPKPTGLQGRKRDEAAQESNLPSDGLRRPAGFEDRIGHQAGATPHAI
jgi:integrase